MSVDTGEAFPRERKCRRTAHLHVCPTLSYFSESFQSQRRYREQLRNGPYLLFLGVTVPRRHLGQICTGSS
jgi:hypothetical protein